jgi:hypothetical protein
MGSPTAPVCGTVRSDRLKLSAPCDTQATYSVSTPEPVKVTRSPAAEYEPFVEGSKDTTPNPPVCRTVPVHVHPRVVSFGTHVTDA